MHAIIKYDKLIIKDFHKKKDNTTSNKPTTNSVKRPLLLSPTEEREQEKNQDLNVEKNKNKKCYNQRTKRFTNKNVIPKKKANHLAILTKNLQNKILA